LKTNFEIQLFFNALNTAWEPCNIVYSMGGQLVFDSDRLENFLIIRDRLVGNTV